MGYSRCIKSIQYEHFREILIATTISVTPCNGHTIVGRTFKLSVHGSYKNELKTYIH